MSSVVVVDSACDLPPGFIKNNPIKVMPLNITLDGNTMADTLTAGQKIELYQLGSLTRNHDAVSSPAGQDQIIQYYLDEIVAEFDFAIGLSVANSRSPNYQNWVDAQTTILRDNHQIRELKGVAGHFGMRVINSATMFTGQGVLAAHTAKLIKEGVNKNEIRERIESFKNTVYGFAVPRDIGYLRERGRKKGDKSVSFAAALIGKALDISPIIKGSQNVTEPVAKVRGFENAVDKLFDCVIERIEEGLETPFVVISIAEAPVKLLRIKKFLELREVAKGKGVEVLRTVMCPSGGINLGPGTISVGFATSNTDFKF